MQADIYDFDKTVVPFDSGSLFVAYCLVHYPWCIVCLPVIACAGVLCLLHIISFTKFKRTCFCFWPLVPKQRAVQKFWDRHEKDVYTWFKKENRPRYAVVISASPDFLLREIAARPGIEIDCLLCTRHDPKSGAIIGENCRGEEKVRRFHEAFDGKDIEIQNVFSDSFRHDGPIFSLGQHCYHIVKGERIAFRYTDIYGAAPAAPDFQKEH